MLLLVGKLTVLEKIEATCRVSFAISMDVWHKHFTGHLHAPAHITSVERVPGTSWTGGRVGPRVGVYLYVFPPQWLNSP